YSDLLYDGIHPNETGYERMATVWAEALTPNLTKPTSSVSSASDQEIPEDVASVVSEARAAMETAQVLSSTETEPLAVGSVVTLSSSNNWKYQFANLPLVDADGNPYIYYVEEIDVPDGYTVSYTGNNVPADEQNPSTMYVTNQSDQELISITVNKEWKCADNDVLPTSIQFQLYEADDASGTNRTECGDAVTLNPNVTNTYTWSNLTSAKYYFVEEINLPDGWISSSEQTEWTNTTSTFNITNTKSVSLIVKKVWSDIEDNEHLMDNVAITVYRSTTPKNGGLTLDEILKLRPTDALSLTVGDTAEFNVNKENVNITFEPEDVVSVESSGNTIKITAQKAGSTEMTVSDGETSYTVEIEVSDFTLSASATTVYVGEEITLTPNPSDEVKYQQGSENGGSVTITGNTVTGKTAGEVKITATRNNQTASVIITVQEKPEDPLTITLNVVESLTVGAETTLMANKTLNNKMVTVSEELELVSVADKVITIKGKAAGDATVTVKYSDTDSVVVNVTVVAAGSTVTGTSGVGSVKLDSTKGIQQIELSVTGVIEWGGFAFDLMNSDSVDPVVRVGAGYGFSTWVTSKWEQDSGTSHVLPTSATYDLSEAGKIKITFDPTIQADELKITKIDHYTSVNYTITYADAATSVSEDSAIYQMPMILQESNEDAQPEFDDDGKLTLELTAKDNWTATLNDLPAYAENGSPYYYWVVETEVLGYTASYRFEDGDSSTEYCINAANGGDSPTATVKNTKKEDAGVTMPSTGGRGVTGYYYTGGALILLSILAGGNRIRRRVKDTRMK
ncbi:MAG: Cna B-type domain-containing protein, partial [Ruminococcus sp.]|nr:Cna B-type domain-containing protein [Ruminococcus sp.]